MIFILPIAVLSILMFLSIISIATFEWKNNHPVSDLPDPWYVKVAIFCGLW